MNQPQLLTKTNPPIWLKTLVIILIGLGIFFRFANLGQKIYCCDESWTSVAISGHTLAELKQESSHYQGTIPITAFNKYQHLNPDRGVADTVNYLITSDPQHPPLYYVMVRLWAQVFGDSPTGVRSLSAIISLFIFPSVYWLCLELFDSTVVGWVAMALMAVSPLQFYFAQEARQYSLWMVEILGSSAALLRAIRQENQVNWAVYTLTLALGLYTHLFTALVMIAHGIYVVIQQQFRFTKTLLNYLLVTIATFLIFLPWLIVIITHIHTAIKLTTGWSLKWIDNPFELIAIFLIRVTRTFFDLNLTSSVVTFNSIALEGPVFYFVPTLILSLILISYLVYFFVKISSNKTVIFIFLMGGFPGILLMAFDIFSGGVRSIQIRYQLPLYLSIEILVAYVLAFYIFQEKTWGQKIGQSMIVGLLIAGLISDVKFFKAENWWPQSSGKFITETSQAINQSEKPLLMINESPIDLGGILTLSNYLPKVHLLSISNDYFLPITQDYSQIFFMNNSNSLFHQLAQDETYDLKVIILLNLPPGGLWEFEKIERA
ncbi:MAG: glycosyltransferase family 39 protein [Stigonema ocellatum SAG 48.90 = DSM 106950]|nr:glycosyltransferase family 39 protein [Stigonema ocellatum SAG 48.90 = DSM 106950]